MNIIVARRGVGETDTETFLLFAYFHLYFQSSGEEDIAHCHLILGALAWLNSSFMCFVTLVKSLNFSDMLITWGQIPALPHPTSLPQASYFTSQSL